MSEICGIYARLSKEDRNKQGYDESESIQNQKSILLKFAVEKGWHVYDIYVDEDYAGTDLSRPEWNRMLKDARTGKINIVLCKTQSRFSRDMEIIEKYIHGKFLEWHTRFVSVVDYADTNIKGNKKARQINGLTNDWFLEDLSDNIKRTLHNKHTEGKHTGSTVLYGYQRDPEKKGYLIIDEEAARTVRRIFQLYIDGNGLERIMNILNAEGIASPSAYKEQRGIKQFSRNKTMLCSLWNKTAIRRILQNLKYLGHAVAEQAGSISYKNPKSVRKCQDEWVIVENVNPPIIDEELFYQVQAKLKSHTRPRGDTGTKRPLSGKVYCGICGSLMESHGEPKNQGHGSSRYRCKAHSYHKEICIGSSIEIKRLEAIVLKKLQELLHSYKDNTLLTRQLQLKDNINSQIRHIEGQLAKQELELEGLNDILTNLYTDRVNKLITEEEFVVLKERFQKTLPEKRETIIGRQKVLKAELEKYNYMRKSQTSLEEIVERYSNVESLTYGMAQQLIDRVEVEAYGAGKKRTEEVRIIWNF